MIIAHLIRCPSSSSSSSSSTDSGIPTLNRPLFRGTTVRWRVIRDEAEEGADEKVETKMSIYDSTCWGYYFAGIGRKISPGLRLRQLLENLQETETIIGFDRWTQYYDIAVSTCLIPL